MSEPFRFLMLGAMYENGGNTTHRFLDGHPEMFVYPFESQVGTRYVNDNLSSLFPLKYRWPSFLLHDTPYNDYKAIIDEEGKVRARTSNVSKFRDWPMDMNDDERCDIYCSIIKDIGRSRGNNMEAFFRATFEAWKDYKRSGRNRVYVGYSPIIGVDGDKIIEDLPHGHVLHVVRNPWSAYADTKKRPVPMSLEKYIFAWNINQYYALYFQKKYPGRYHVIRTEDTLADPYKTLSKLCEALDVEPNESLKKVTWNSNELGQVYPWGTIRIPTPQANKNTANELSDAEKGQIRDMTWQYLDVFDYRSFV
jgi:hypothetical protein